MPTIEINDLGSIGLIRDQEGYMLPPEAWTLASNMRVSAEGIERLDGQTQIFGTPTVAPHFALPVQSSSQTYWLYVSLTEAHVWDGSVHTEITRLSGDYNAGQTRNWNGTLLGGVPILNNGVDAPQYWPALNTASELADLVDWPASTTAKVLRAFGPHLFALGLTVSGTEYPHMVRWSHPADPGTIPSSWDVTDATVDAGQTDLPDVNAGVIKDGLPLRGNLFIYKEASTWIVRFIGGLFIFDFDTFLETSGILAPRCVTITGDGTRHVVATQDDLIVHNGNSAESILTRRYKNYFASNIDTDNYVNSFVFTNPFRDEVVFCYPESGQTNPNRALIWNYREGKLGALTEADVNYRNAATGIIEAAAGTLWSTTSTTWTTETNPWASSQGGRRRVVVCGTDQTKFFEWDSGETNDGVSYLGLLRRDGLALIGKKRNGEPIVDFTARKFVRRVWIKAAGGPIDVRVGFQELVDGEVVWSPVVSFDPTTQLWVDVVGSGKAIGVQFSASVHFRIRGYSLEGNVVGTF
jgi:hypothetical protein